MKQSGSRRQNAFFLALASAALLDSEERTSAAVMIAFYYGITWFACAIYYRRELLKSAKNFFFIGVCPVVGGLILAALFVKSVHDLANDHESFGTAFGWGLAAVIGVGALVLGVVLMIAWNVQEPEFFRRKPEVADPALLESGPAVEGSGV